MNRAFLIFIFVIIAYAGFVHAQNGPAEPRPILVDVITSHSKVRETRGSPVNNSVGSANETEARAFELMNAQRIVSGLKTLQWDDGIAELARLHSRNMAASKQFSHRGQDGGFVDDRAAKLGIFNWLAIGENIAFMKGYPDPASTAVEKWMLSTSHKKNILSDQWRESAIGVAVGDNGSIYFTQVFIAR